VLNGALLRGPTAMTYEGLAAALDHALGA
jgi:hypothetical protein